MLGSSPMDPKWSASVSSRVATEDPILTPSRSNSRPGEGADPQQPGHRRDRDAQEPRRREDAPRLRSCKVQLWREQRLGGRDVDEDHEADGGEREERWPPHPQHGSDDVPETRPRASLLSASRALLTTRLALKRAMKAKEINHPKGARPCALQTAGANLAKSAETQNCWKIAQTSLQEPTCMFHPFLGRIRPAWGSFRPIWNQVCLQLDDSGMDLARSSS